MSGRPSARKLNVLQVCDHLGWEGSRMHGVKRLFSWMIPRFDPERFNVSLVSLRKKDLSEETLESMGIDISYLHRSKFDPATLTALLKVIDRQQTDILHLHGYGATTFGRIAGQMRRLPTILHEHANLTTTPWFQKVADRLLAPATDLAIAVSKSTAEFVDQRAPDAAGTRQGGVSRRAAGGVQPQPDRAGDRRSAARARRAAGRVRGRHGDPAARLEGQFVSRRGGGRRCCASGRRPGSTCSARDRCGRSWRHRRRRWACGDRFVFGGFTRDVARTVSAFDISVFPSLWEGTPLTVFETLAMGKPIVATDADGLLDVLTHEHDALIVPQPRRRRRWRAAIVRLMDSPEDRARLSVHARLTGRQYDIAAFVRKMERLYVLLHDVSRRTKRQGVLQADLSFLTEGAARVTARPGLALAAIFLCIYGALALTVDLPKATYGFKSDEATYYMMGLSLARDGDLTYERRIWFASGRSFPRARRACSSSAATKIGGAPDPDPSRYFYGKSFIYPLFAAPFILLFGSNGFLVLNALALALVLLCAYLFLHARSGPWPSAILAVGLRDDERRPGLLRCR